MRYIFLLIAFFLTSCSHQFLDVHRRYISHDYLMSRKVETLDLRENIEIEGELITLFWSIPKDKRNQKWTLEIDLIYNNFSFESIEVPLVQNKGSYLFQILNEEYHQKKGIRSYRIRLTSNQEILEEWRHPLWSELIIIEDGEG
jgi:hypothetical protein